jgi:hypothetical protein
MMNTISLPNLMIQQVSQFVSETQRVISSFVDKIFRPDVIIPSTSISYNHLVTLEDHLSLYPPGKVRDTVILWRALSKAINVSVLFSPDQSLEAQFNDWLAAHKPSLAEIKTLILQNNTYQLTSLPPQIGKLTQLQELYIDSPLLTEIPAEIEELVNLRLFSWEQMQPQPIPEALASLHRDCQLILKGTEVAFIDIQVFYTQTLIARTNNPDKGPAISDISPFKNLDGVSHASLVCQMSQLAEREKAVPPIAPPKALLSDVAVQMGFALDPNPNWYTDENHFNYVVPEELLIDHQYRILAGRAKEVIAEGLTEEGKANIAVAKKIIAYVGETVPFSYNYPCRSKIYQFAQNQAELEAIENAVFDAVKVVQSVYPMGLHDCIDAAHMYRTGNCNEDAMVGYRYGTQLPNAPRIEIFHIEGGNHAFLVIGRKEGSLPHDFENFGESCMVCDTWSRAYFPATRAKDYLLDFKVARRWHQYIVTEVAPFDPSSGQKLAVDTFASYLINGEVKI